VPDIDRIALSHATPAVGRVLLSHAVDPLLTVGEAGSGL